MDRLFFTDLQQHGGKAFPGFAVGEFVDMRGREIVVEEDDLDTYLANTLRAINEHQKRGMPGLPIDARNHDMGDAAGWIIDAQKGQVEDSNGAAVPVIEIVADWTKLGQELIRDKLQTNFSPTFDLNAKVIEGGSLTNWPASVDDNGIPLFHAIELSRGLSYLQESMDERLRQIRDAFHDKYSPRPAAEYDMWVIDVYDEEGYVIAEAGEDRYRIPYEELEDGIEFAPRDEWVAVEKQWVEAQRGYRYETVYQVAGQDRPSEGDMSMGQEQDDGQKAVTPEKEPAKTPDLAELRQQVRNELREEIRSEVIAELAPGDADTPEDALARLRESLNLEAFADVADLSQARDSLLSEMQKALKAEYDRMQAQAGTMFRDMMAQMKRDQHIAELSQKWTGGTEQHPHGLPVGREEVETFLMGLNDKQRQAAESILGRIWEHGLTEFSELGHGKEVKQRQPVPEYVRPALQQAVANGTDLKAFFDAAGLGDVDRYDLSEFTEAGNG